MAQRWRDVPCYNTPKLLNHVLDGLDRRELLMLEMMKASFDSKEIFQFGKICLSDSEAKLLLLILLEKHYLRYICFNQLTVIYPWVG